MPNQESPESVQLSPSATASQGRVGRFRWWICGLLFFATTVNYLDRQVIGILKPKMMEDLHWDEQDFAHLVSAFQVAYAVGFAVAGRLLDRIGIRIGLALAVTLWSLAAAAHGLMQSILGFMSMRFLLGLSEGANFPAAVKGVGEWFPRKERALATGLFNAGSNVGILLAAIMVPWLAEQWGWRAAFFVTGCMGLAWLAVWLPVYDRPERHPRVTPQEFAYIRSDPAVPPIEISWGELLRHRQVWAFMIAFAMVSPVWWFYLYWVPGFLYDTYRLNLRDLGAPLVVIYLMTDVGSVGGGWLSSTLIQRGWSVNASRKTAMLACALCVVPVFSVVYVDNLWLATLLIGLAASAHQGFSANLFTLVSDTVPPQAVSSTVGLGGMAGGFVGMLTAEAVGRLLNNEAVGGQLKKDPGNYLIPFLVASFAYLVVVAIIHGILPRLEPMLLEDTEPTTEHIGAE